LKSGPHAGKYEIVVKSSLLFGYKIIVDANDISSAEFNSEDTELESRILIVNKYIDN
jgi:hypothetical protein